MVKSHDIGWITDRFVIVVLFRRRFSAVIIRGIRLTAREWCIQIDNYGHAIRIDDPCPVPFLRTVEVFVVGDAAAFVLYEEGKI